MAQTDQDRAARTRTRRVEQVRQDLATLAQFVQAERSPGGDLDNLTEADWRNLAAAAGAVQRRARQLGGLGRGG